MMARSSLLSPLLLSPLFALLLSVPATAARLELADTLTLLASPQGKPSAFTRTIELPAGESRLLVRFDSPSDPRSTNESQGRMTSAPLLLTLTASSQGTLQLTTPVLTSSSAIRQFAASPALLLSDDKGTSQPLALQALPRSQDSLGTDYQALLESHTPTVSPAPIFATQAATTAHTASALTPEQADATLRELYLAADAKRRKAFIRWALDL
ncbi:DUF2057 family protein [Aeromonas jandaei]|uniref:DUF2057 family protein n=1 Tax=Aeromonas jandaei TaxID=650 RepID=UPI001F38A727|nr:DUF2057 family protein [Aeromonas jandaei]